MTRGNQREIDRARAQARNAKNAKQKDSQGDRLLNKMNDADIMREKQRKAELKKQGIVEEDQPQKKEFDDSYLKQFYGEEDDAGEEKKTEEVEEEKKTDEVIKPKGKKGKK